MAAIDAALGVTSRADLAELGAGGRNAASLRKIADDPEAHANAVVFIRILAETDRRRARHRRVHAPVRQHLVGDARRRGAHDRASRSSSSARARAPSGRQHAEGLLRGAAPVIRGVRIILGPLAHGLVALGNRVTPGASRGSSFASEEQLLSIIDEAAENELIEEDDRELIHSVFDFTDTFVRAVMVPRTDMVTVDAVGLDARGDERSSSRRASPASRSSTTTPMTSSACSTSRTSCSSASATRRAGAMRPISRDRAAARCSCPSR